MTGAAGGLLRFGHLLDMLMIPICALLALVSAGLAAFSRSQRIRERALCFIGRNRKEGGVPDKMRAARFALALSMGIRSGCSAEEALEAAAGLLGDGAKARCLECLEKAADGEALGELLEEASILPRAECRLLMLGLRSGSGEEAAEEVARRLGRDAD